MFDPRYEKLAKVLVNHSTKIQPGENALIEAIDIPEEMVIALIREIRKAGGKPLVTIKQNRIQRELIRETDEITMRQFADVESFRMDKVQAYFGLRGSNNISEMSDVSSEKMGRQMSKKMAAQI